MELNMDKLTINQALDIYALMQLILKREQKVDQGATHFWVLALNNANKILNLELVSQGSVSSAIVKPMEVLSIPLQKQAAGVILVHNHPSGQLTPSEEDKDLTDCLIQACKLMNTPVLDHVIITAHSYLSFKETGLLERLEASLQYVPSYELERQYHKKAQAAIQEVENESTIKIKASLKKGLEKGLKRGLEKGVEKTAKHMLQDGEPIEKIKKWTGLSAAKIQALKEA